MNDYTAWGCQPAGSCDTICNSEGNNLYSSLTASGSGYTPLVRYWDGSVWDSDFHDPQYTGSGLDDDTYNFDKAGAAISYVCAHGTCGDVTNTTCSSDASCPAGSYCPRMPPMGFGYAKVCIQEKQRQIAVSGSTVRHGNFVNYGRDYNQALASTVALGEGTAGGSFAGAGTNGGTNLAFVVNSCGLRSQYFVAATFKMFAGVHSLHMLVPVAAWRKNTNGLLYASDARTEPNRGTDLAYAAKTNPNSAVADAWLNATIAGYSFTSVPLSDNSTPANFPWGCAITIGRDHTSALAAWHTNQESWAQAKNESNDAKGNVYWAARIYCNYDSATYGF